MVNFLEHDVCEGEGMAIRRMKAISDGDKTAILRELKSFLSHREEVVFALLYGSMVAPVVPERYGDIDVAIYIESGHLKRPEYVLESEIEAQIYSLLSSRGLNLAPLEVRVINQAPCSFLIQLFKGNYEVLKENDERLTDFIEEVGRKSMANSYLRFESLREVAEG